MIGTFPHDSVPDGSILAPHHYPLGMLLAILVLAVVWDNYRKREPVLVAFSVLVGMFGFLLTWRVYPTVGAIMALVGNLAAITALVAGWAGWPETSPWSDYPLQWRIMAIVFLVMALDDGVSHAFGVWTPLDWLWKEHIVRTITGW